MIRVVLPSQLGILARTPTEIAIETSGDVTLRSVLDAVEARFPALRGAIRDAASGKRRAFIRFFACGRDLSHDDPAEPLPAPVRDGTEPLLIVGAIAGG